MRTCGSCGSVPGFISFRYLTRNEFTSIHIRIVQAVSHLGRNAISLDASREPRPEIGEAEIMNRSEKVRAIAVAFASAGVLALTMSMGNAVDTNSVSQP